MRTTSVTDETIAETIGKHIEAIRLKRNLHQEYVAHEAAIARETYRQIILGKGKLINVIAVLRALGVLDRLTSLIADVPTSPLQLAKLAGKYV